MRGVKLVGAYKYGTRGGKTVERLAYEPLTGSELQVTRGEVIAAGVAENVGGGVLL